MIRKYNIKSNVIVPKFGRKPTNELSGLILGRNVEIKEAEEYLMRYFREEGITNSIISIKDSKVNKLLDNHKDFQILFYLVT